MERITISVPDEIALKAEKRAATEKRSVSSYVSLLIESDLVEAGLMPRVGTTGADELIAKVRAAVDADSSLCPQIERVLAKSTRAKRTVA